MVLKFFSLAGLFLLVSCVSIERNNPDDPGSNNYYGGKNSSATNSSSSVEVVYGDPVNYMGETYQTVVIGTQTWFKRNLNYAAKGSKCDNGIALTDENTETCDKYGRLYDWATAMTACPDGWHIPSFEEWGNLMQYANTNCRIGEDRCAKAGTKLKAANGWNSYDGVPVGTDDYGFSALPGGDGVDGELCDVGYSGYWWGSNEYNSDGKENIGGGYGLVMNINFSEEFVLIGSLDKNYFFSVRCLKD